jgi:hypothetical protein
LNWKDRKDRRAWEYQGEKKKKVREKEKGKPEQRGSWKDIRKMSRLAGEARPGIWKTDWGLYLDCHDLQ